MTLPEFSLDSANGARITNGDLQGRKTLLVFTRGTGSRRAQELLSELERNVHKFSAVGVAIVAVTPEDGESAAEFANAAGLSFPLLLDSEHKLSTSFGVRHRFSFSRLPSWFIIAEGGDILASGSAGPGAVNEVFQRCVDLVASRARR